MQAIKYNGWHTETPLLSYGNFFRKGDNNRIRAEKAWPTPTTYEDILL